MGGRWPSNTVPITTGNATPPAALTGTTTDIEPRLMPRNRNVMAAPVPSPDNAPQARSTACGGPVDTHGAANTVTTRPPI